MRVELKNQRNIRTKFTNSIEKLLLCDKYLLQHDTHERSITHKLAEYLQIEFGDSYNVDCEYNRNIEGEDGLKRIYVLRQELAIIRERQTTNKFQDDDEISSLSVYPDIIVHKRGTNQNNLLVIEVKKTTSSINKDYDYLKLRNYTDQSGRNGLHYMFGIFLEVETNTNKPKISKLVWFISGEIDSE